MTAPVRTLVHPSSDGPSIEKKFTISFYLPTAYQACSRPLI
jgi:SOUL heme-binding protein